MRNAFVAAVGLVLAACAAKPRVDEAAQARAADAVESWSLSGRVAVSNGQDGGSGRIEWQQRGETYDITIRAPVSGQTWRLSNVDGTVKLEGVRKAPLYGDDAEELLAREAGWRLPIREMQRWVRGIPASGDATIEKNAQGLPESIAESGWTVAYRGWDASQTPAMPTRIAATRPPYKVRLAVSAWSVE